MSNLATYNWLVITLKAPLISFGGAAVDQKGVIRDFPASSMITGLIANALGWKRTDTANLQALQDSLVFATRLEQSTSNPVLTDTQNVKLSKSDKGWTTRGIVEMCTSGNTDAPHRRFRDFHQDLNAIVALRFDDANLPDLADVASALDTPCRPLFIGRKTCLPTGPIRYGELISAPSAYEAIASIPTSVVNDAGVPCQLRALWPVNNGPSEGPNVHKVHNLPDTRNWQSRLHGGSRLVVEGYVSPPKITTGDITNV
ncbi:type I-E CRISPR-associated protein Cas5/CasD [Thalassospira xianhensis]|uniref:CRISPR-associated protein Cas5 n=1 Tax=Thalassospira xianhensis MCCC 1A02616 TaxID=1177929 RepID=A0A367UF72_9PROT|nr:type I-E CRISPR-associated protein Cas5/CasD [Thalassospira xianhensis]RCK06323.1 hypothetical protein TH5_08970 [Thalassospira xianhensis MCCC 1A02616]